VEFRVLGPVEALVAGQPIDTGHARQRSVLAVLLLDLGRAVPAERLIDRVWGDSPPASVRNVLYSYVARLRAAIAAAGAGAGAGEVTLRRRSEGYVLEADAERLDLSRFRRQVAEAAAAGSAGDDERAAGLLRAALGLWHGPALAGLSSPWLRGMADTLELQRVAAVLDLGDIALRAGQHAGLVGILAQEAAASPADERLIGQLMLALYRSGRQAEALRWFEQTRQRVADELGADPDPALQALHQRILRGDPSLSPAVPPAAAGPPPPAASTAGASTAGTSRVGTSTAGASTAGTSTAGASTAGAAPRELPADVSWFTGRSAELAALDRLLAGAADAAADGAGAAPAVVISAVSGTAGVGKTALAVRWAQRAAWRFPDGQLYVNLRGYDPGPPVTAADALAGFLHALGVPGPDIPAEEAGRAARYRSLLAGRRMLVVLDNASSAGQVRPLLPAAPRCRVVVTSRDALAGLVARDGAARLDLDLLPLDDAVSLLRALIGGRVDADTGAAQELARHCARLPLALRVAAEFACARPGAGLGALVAELADQRRRLDLLDAGGDDRTAVRAVFSWSYEHLDADTARTFRLAGLHPGLDLDGYAAAALTASSTERAGLLLARLAGAHLVQPAGPDRYSLHDLLRDYARELAAVDGDEAQRAAVTRLLDYYLHTAATAMNTLYPAEQHRRPAVGPPVVPGPDVAEPGAARTWLDTERPALAAVAVHAAAHGWPDHAIKLAATLFRYLDTNGHYPEAIAIHTAAGRAARDTGDLAAEAEPLIHLGAIDARQCRYQHAAGHLEQALALARQAGDLGVQGRALGSLGLVYWHQGHYDQAVGLYQQALALHREAGDRTAEARALGNLSIIDAQQGRYDQAAGHLREVLALARETGDQTSEACSLDLLGDIRRRQGRHDEAAGHLRQALALFREIGDRSGEAHALTNLGGLALLEGRYQQAAGYQQEALAVSAAIGERAGEAEALSALGEVSLATGQPDQARTHYAAALGIAGQIGEKYEQARACDGLGRVCHSAGQGDEARSHWREALALYAELGAPEADQVRAQLADAEAEPAQTPSPAPTT